ncbi:hypothetical protein NDU88_000653 [Pleurodeles waltl]|uniref:Uncharacterized protein n=1 Tax=Pleurodeles waltl TaxID=8319 RepID=A0AAV7KPZ6_PLEWA|nr:hypothetical protein NDU88_000653 [Pleurodeles waltl]
MHTDDLTSNYPATKRAAEERQIPPVFSLQNTIFDNVLMEGACPQAASELQRHSHCGAALLRKWRCHISPFLRREPRAWPTYGAHREGGRLA